MTTDSSAQPLTVPPALERAGQALDPAPWRSEHPASRARRTVVVDDARRVLTAALNDPADPEWLDRELARHQNATVRQVGRRGSLIINGRVCDCDHELPWEDWQLALVSHQREVLVAALLG